MNGKSGDLLKNKRRLSSAAGVLANYGGPSDLEHIAREYNTAIIFSDTQAIDANTAITRYTQDSWNGEVWYMLYTDDVSSLGVSRREVLTFASFLRVIHEVKATSGGAQVGATFGAGITYKQT